MLVNVHDSFSDRESTLCALGQICDGYIPGLVILDFFLSNFKNVTLYLLSMM